MLTGAVVCFALAALGGTVLALQHRGSGTPPMPLALGHGLLAATGLVLLILSATTGSSSMGGLGTGSIAAFVVAALGGFYLFSQRFSADDTPFGLVLVHGGVAVVGFVLLLVVYL